MTDSTSTRTQAERADQTRSRILDAAIRAFSENGLAGARTERIAEAAGVNKALLYYYFESKENLYLAALETIAGKMRDNVVAVFLLDASPGERVMRSALSHFDRMLTQTGFQSLLQQEMIRLHKGESGAMPVLVKRVFAPMLSMFQSLVREGIASGELIDVDWMQIHLASLGSNVFYFLSAPIWQMVLPFDLFAPEVLAARRRAIIEFLGHAIFQDRQHGADLAARVLADTPIPDFERAGPLLGRRYERAK
jgi:TetR/AcrR family transcriptional regulator